MKKSQRQTEKKQRKTPQEKQNKEPIIPANAQKAYKLLALQERISNNEAKALIDKGLVSLQGKTLKIARALLSPNTKFKVIKPQKVNEIFRDENILALDKPAFLTSEEIIKDYPQWTLLHRLDKETSGILLLVKPESEFHLKAKEEFKNEKVFKQYLAIVQGILKDECEIDTPLLIKKGSFARVSVSKNKEGQKAFTKVTPLEIEGKKTKVQVEIKTGKTHQIRVHLSSINHPLIGDTFYGAKPAQRIMLHAYKIALLGYDFCINPPKDFNF